MTPANPGISGLGDPVYARIRERIRQDILSGVFEPGLRIKMAALSARYGVSQMPIREALQQLQGEGLVTIAPNRGASVRKVDEQFIRNIYDIRAALETMLVKRGVEVVTDSQVFALYAIESRLEEAVQRADLGTVSAINRNLHETMYRLADNPEAMDVIGRHSELLQSLRRRFGYGANRMAEIVAEHRRLLRAFDQRDVAVAVRTTEEHCEHAKQDLLTQATSALQPEHREHRGQK